LVAAVDLQLDDGIHIGTQDLKRVARRLADLVCLDLFPRIKNYGQRKRGPRPVAAVYQDGFVKVSFSGVNGRLQSEGPIYGFSIHQPDGERVPMIYKSHVDPAEASTVLLSVQGKLPQGARLWYGFGKDPYCNLRDAGDMAVPVFEIKIANPGVGTR
jgi:sialate O-acetylesterase